VKRRVSKQRDVIVTDHAIAIFREMRAAARRCGCESTNECLACRWGDVHSELHSELKLPPWMWPCLRHTLEECSDQRYVGVHKSWVSQRELWLLLRDVERAAKRVPAVEPVAETGASTLN
jgi:hypothetical protein